MHPIKDLAIVLRSIRYEERHRIVTALTEHHGVISALAKNSIQSRRFGATLESFVASDWIMTHKPGAELAFLTEAQIRHSFAELSQDFDKFSLASVFSELLLRMPPRGDACPALFRLHCNALSSLASMPSGDTSSVYRLTLLNTYLGKLLQWSGSQPSLHQCFQCKTPLEQISQDAYVHAKIADGGWICSSCFSENPKHSALKLSPKVLLDFQVSLRVPIRQAVQRFGTSIQEQRSFFQFLESFYAYHVPGFDQNPLKSLRFLESTLPLEAKYHTQTPPDPAATDSQ